VGKIRKMDKLRRGLNITRYIRILFPPLIRANNLALVISQKGPSMKTVKTIVALALVLASCATYAFVRAENPGAEPKPAKLRVGTFDSRAVAIAYARSADFGRQIRKLKVDRDKAKADGDEKKARELEEQGQSRQQLLHMQGFSTASVNDMLEHMKDKLPDIAKQAGVALIVSKWDIPYKSPDAELVDITDLMVKPFASDEQTQKIIRELKNHDPISLEEALNIKD
jgi:hypothetical protein